MSLSRTRSHAAESHQDVRNSSIDPWEEAYLQVEAPEDEIRKFTGRLRRLGVSAWPKDTQVIELFCGRGNGLRAWEKLGFRNLEGVDLSPRLIAKYDGPARCYVADCRHLPFSDASRAPAVVQGVLLDLILLPVGL